MHEPAFDIAEEEYIQWDYGKGYVDALTDTGLEPERRIELTRCPWCQFPFAEDHAFCPRCGRSMGAVRLYQELIGKGMEERDVRALLVRAGFEPF
jgi:predicted amidophosphoribosyltransferase